MHPLLWIHPIHLSVDALLLGCTPPAYQWMHPLLWIHPIHLSVDAPLLGCTPPAYQWMHPSLDALHPPISGCIPPWMHSTRLSVDAPHPPISGCTPPWMHPTRLSIISPRNRSCTGNANLILLKDGYSYQSLDFISRHHDKSKVTFFQLVTTSNLLPPA